ncbi:PAS domain S-box protein [Stutzerimonas stutzeri]|uniref:PAS domain-containing sensor histidine kinase n=1 Tax=Stutzerimonas sp. S1 TaxID=3030652 RepID=UPI00222586E8|nr:PAS domain S-box protein [Stutzerimonas sp. S1]MCW3147666.1 PAS domain S-box protein [Stutzerimonas sp. S1]
MTPLRLPTPRRIFGLGSLLLAVLFGALALNDYLGRVAVWQLEIANQGQLQSLALQSAQRGQERQAQMLAAALGSDPRLLASMRQIDRELRAGTPWDAATLTRLRQQLSDTLQPAWQAMQAQQGLQLQLFWSEAGIGVLHMQQPDAFGEAQAARQPLLAAALREGRPQAGLVIDQHGASSRSIVPLRSGDDATGAVIGALEVGFGSLPKLDQLSAQLGAGLALIIDRKALPASTSAPIGVQLGHDSDWLLTGHSATQILHWAQMNQLPTPANDTAQGLLQADGRTFLVNQIPLHDAREQQQGTPLAAALAWRDISPLVREHANVDQRLLLKWGIAWLIAELLLWLLVYLLQRRLIVQRQHQLSRQQHARSHQRMLERAQKIASLLPGMVFQLKRYADGRHAFLYVSEGARALYGQSPENLIGDPQLATAGVHPDDLPRLRSTLTRAIREGKAATEFRLEHPQRGTLWIEGRASAESLADGAVLWHGFATEITELMAATRALQQSESRYRGMVGNLPGAVYRCRNDAERRMSYLSDGIERLTGYPASDFIDNRLRSYLSLVHPDDLPRARRPDGAEVFELTYRIRDAQGRGLWLRERGRMVHEQDGAAQWCEGFIWDVTAHMRAEQDMQERERYLSMLIDNVIDAIIIIDERGIIETFNHAAEQIFGYRGEEIIGHNLSQLMPEPDRSAHDGYLAHYVRSGHSRALEQNRELVAQRRNGETFTIELRVSQIMHHGERKFIGLVRDITERKRIERMKSELVSIVSHELRTPLTSIAGALGLITGGALGGAPAPMQQMLAIAHQNSLRLGRLIDDLLDMDKLVAGKMAFDMRIQHLRPLLEQAISSNQGYADQQQVRFVLQAAADPLVEVDDSRLQQVLANLLVNAIKFSPVGGIVELASEQRGDWVRVSVRDQGPGVPEEFRSRIFEKFSQADSSDTRQKGGTGLGLAISKELTEHMRGRLGFDSVPGQGACFWFELPIAASVTAPS